MSANQRLDRTFELRVLDGEQRGASATVRPGVPLSVSGRWKSDIVLRSKAVNGHSIEFVLHDHDIELKACEGNARVGDRVLEAGQSARVPMYTPIMIGDTPVALGELGASAWGPLFARSPDNEATAAAHDAGQAADSGKGSSAAPQKWLRALLLGGGALTVASLSVLAFAFAVAPQKQSMAERVRHAQALLASQGFAALAVRPDDTGQLVLSGYVGTTAQRARAEQVLVDAGITPRLDVKVEESIIASVTEVYRINGVTADVKGIGPGTVSVQTSVADPQVLTRIESEVRRDVPGLAQMSVQNRPPPKRPAPERIVDDPGKRIAAVVSGNPGYVVTSDGTRYFVGALLPTGHSILSIEDQQVMVERDGEIRPLVF
jgi:type III secretion protein D